MAEGLSFSDAFFNPAAVKANDTDPLLKYLASDPAQELDTKVVDELRNLLLASPRSTVRLDLAAINIQRGRDDGLADYSTTRVALGKSRVTDFSQITSNAEMAARLKEVYGSVDEMIQPLTLDEIATRTGLHEGSVRRIIRQLSRQVAVKTEGVGWARRR